MKETHVRLILGLLALLGIVWAIGHGLDRCGELEECERAMAEC